MARICAALLALAMSVAWGQDFPSKPVRIIVASAPGGGYDFTGRLLAERLSAELGQPSAAAPADGYTLVMGGLANGVQPRHAQGPALRPGT